MLHARRALDPRWIVHHRRVPAGFMIHPISIYRMVDQEVVRDPITGEYTVGELTLLWQGDARVQPNKDWRARNVESANDPQMVHYTRVQIQSPRHNPTPTFRVADVVVCEEVTDTEDWVFNHDLEAWTMYIRNAQNSSNRWLTNLLCSADLSDQVGGVV